jgi:hypothetical protein
MTEWSCNSWRRAMTDKHLPKILLLMDFKQLKLVCIEVRIADWLIIRYRSTISIDLIGFVSEYDG